VRPLADAEVPRAIEVLAGAFDADPMYRFLLPEGRRAEWLRFVMGAVLARDRPEGHVYALPDLAGVIALVPPGRWPIAGSRSLGYFLRSWGRPGMPWPTAALLSRGRAVSALMDRLHPAEPHWYIEVVAVAPAQQGRGHGRRMLEPAVALADRDGLPTYLETTNPANAALYARFGFVPIEEVTLPGGFPPLLTMRRAP
jgi:GNAT superfamily N-acetyltransferase